MHFNLLFLLTPINWIKLSFKLYTFVGCLYFLWKLNNVILYMLSETPVFWYQPSWCSVARVGLEWQCLGPCRCWGHGGLHVFSCLLHTWGKCGSWEVMVECGQVFYWSIIIWHKCKPWRLRLVLFLVLVI